MSQLSEAIERANVRLSRMSEAQRVKLYAVVLRDELNRDSGSDPKGENSRSEVEAESSQSGDAEGSASPTPLSGDSPNG